MCGRLSGRAVLLPGQEMDRRIRRSPWGLDTLVFAGGIGENAPLVRARVCGGLAFLGIELNETRNADSAGVISTEPAGSGPCHPYG